MNAIASLFVPGLGQMNQGRTGAAIGHFLLGVLFWVGTFGLLGWLVNVCSAFNAAAWDAKEKREAQHRERVKELREELADEVSDETPQLQRKA